MRSPRSATVDTIRCEAWKFGTRFSAVRAKLAEVVFTFGHRQTDVTEKYFFRVDVTEQFPYLVTKLAPYLDR
jgi:hypothetical protein